TGTIATTASYGLAFGAPPHLAADTPASTGANTWIVTEVKVKVGDTVKKGAILATADTADLRRQLVDAENTLRIAKIQLSNAQDAVDDASGTTANRAAKIGLYNAETQVSTTNHARRDLQAQI